MLRRSVVKREMTKESGEDEAVTTAKTLKSLRESIEIIEKRQDVFEDQLSPAMLGRIREVEKDLRGIAVSVPIVTTAVGGLVDDIEKLNGKLETCLSCGQYKKESQRGVFAKELSEYKKLKEAGDVQKARDALKEIRRKYARFSELWVELGEMYSENEDLENALACFRIADELGDLQYLPLCRIAETLGRMDRHSDAMIVLEKSLRMYLPTHRCPDFYRALAHCYSKLESKERIERIERISEFVDDPEAPAEPHVVKAYLYLLVGETEKSHEAIKDVDDELSGQVRLLKTVTVDPTEYETARTRILESLSGTEPDRLVLDVAYYSLKRGIFADNCEPLRQLIVILNTWLKSKYRESASKILSIAFVQAMREGCSHETFILDLINKANVDEHLSILDDTLAYYLAGTGHVDEAMKIAESSNTSVIWYSLGTALCHLGRKEDALSAFRNSVKLDTKNWPAWMCLLGTLKALNLKEELARIKPEAEDALGERFPDEMFEEHCERDKS